MRRSPRVALAIGLAGFAITLPTKVGAQGFFQQLFGGGAPVPQAQTPRPALQPSMLSPYGYRAPLYQPHRPRENSIDDHVQPERSGRYRTMCVRMCDGYYWPVSFATTRNSFYRDANICRASCGDEARLFFQAANDGDTRDMTDLTGRAYTKLPTAYRYRKTQVEGCKCKPDPWAESELNRHRLYALNQTTEERWRKDKTQRDEVAAKDNGSTENAQTAQSKEPIEGEKMPDSLDARHSEIGRPFADASARPRATRSGRSTAPSSNSSIGPTTSPPRPVRTAAPPIKTPPYGLGAGGANSRWPGD